MRAPTQFLARGKVMRDACVPDEGISGRAPGRRDTAHSTVGPRRTRLGTAVAQAPRSASRNGFETRDRKRRSAIRLVGRPHLPVRHALCYLDIPSGHLLLAV
jgi:hypothetical protein